MPPIARVFLPVLLGVSLPCLAAQTTTPDGSRGGQPRGTNSQSYGPPRMARAPEAPSDHTSQGPRGRDGPAAQRSGASAAAAEPGPSSNSALRLPLPPPAGASGSSADSDGRRNGNPKAGGIGGVSSLLTTAGSLAVVLGLFFVLACMLRRAAPRGAMLLPGEVIEVLGRSPLANRQQVYLLRCGNKLLLVSATSAGVEPLTEVTDPEEVDRLAGLCRAAQPGSATAAFRNVLQQFSQQRKRLGLSPGNDDMRLAGAGIHRGHDITSEGHDV